MEENGQVDAPASLLPGKQPQYSLYRRLGGPQILSGRYGEEKNLFPIPAIKPRFLGRPARNVVVIPTELSSGNFFHHAMTSLPAALLLHIDPR
jgi:hypothetical protein